MWGQDVGIVSKVVQTCTKEICRSLWEIIANAVAIALGAELVWVFLTLGLHNIYHKVSPTRQRKQPLFLEFCPPPSEVVAALTIDWLVG